MEKEKVAQRCDKTKAGRASSRALPWALVDPFPLLSLPHPVDEHALPWGLSVMGEVVVVL